jgi:thioredoxin-like negative regulator of GroEL
MNLGDHSLEADDVDGALAHYGQAEALAPDNLEMKFWHAVSLVNAGRVDDAMPLFATVFRQDRDWQTLLPRLAAEELVNADPATLSRIMKVNPQEALQ